MAGAGIVKALYNESEYESILDALSKASPDDLFAVADAAGGELHYISAKAFEKGKDPVTGRSWAKVKGTPAKGTKTLWRSAHLKDSLDWEAASDGTVVFGSNVEYARIHQMGGKTGRNHAAKIPKRPYMGVPRDFNRRFFNDPEILKLLGLGG